METQWVTAEPPTDWADLLGADEALKPLAIARSYIARGWAPVPIPTRQKGPQSKGWGRLRLDADTAAQHFNGQAQNIGIILGEASGGLVDIDLDSVEARSLAPAFLPPTPAVFGRQGNPDSHWLYRAPDLRTEQVREPGSSKTLLELRSNSGTDQPSQTVFPGSRHESGESIEWRGSAGEPATCDRDELLHAFRRLAAATIAARAFPSEGGRHNATLTLIGFLTRAGWNEDSVIEFTRAIRDAAGADRKKALKSMARDAAKRLSADKSLFGLPSLREAFGEKAAERTVELLGCERPDGIGPDDFDELPESDLNLLGGAPAKLPDLRLIDPAAWHGADLPQREWALREWIPMGQATYLTGPGSAGKSLITQQLATCIALGRPFLGIETREARALYLTCEDDALELHRRQIAICAMLEAPLSSLSGRLFLSSLAGETDTELCTFSDRGELRVAPRFDSLEAAASGNGITFVALDNVAHLFAGNENARHDVAAFVALLNRLAMRIGGAVLFLGHPNKAGGSFSGSTAWENQVRSRLFLETPSEADGSPIDRDARVLSRQKANYARNGETVKFRWYEWAFARDADLPMSVCASARAGIEDDAFMACLAKTAAERRAVSPNASASNYAPRVFAKMPLGEGIGHRGFEAALQRLLHRGAILNGQNVYQRDNRAWATGLGVAPTLARTLHQAMHEPCTEPAPTPAPTRTHPPPYTTYMAGAAHEPPYPAFRDEVNAFDADDEGAA